jgi:predicted  nucleic acid-binding Zn-ribbon protein
MENEQSKETLLVLFEDKLDNLIEAVKDIKDSITHTSEQVQAMKIDIVTMQNKTEQQQKEIDKLYEKNTRNQGWIMGLGASIIAGILIAILKSVFGI